MHYTPRDAKMRMKWWTSKLFSWPKTHSIPFYWSQRAGESFQIFYFSSYATHLPSTWFFLECLGPMNLKGGNTKTCSPKPFDVQWFGYLSVCSHDKHDRMLFLNCFFLLLNANDICQLHCQIQNGCSLRIKDKSMSVHL